MARRSLIALAVVATAGGAAAATPENFDFDQAGDLIALCSVQPGQPYYEAAIHSCHAYGLGAWHYYLASTSGSPAHAFVCVPEPRPGVARVAEDFAAWGRARPALHADPAVEVLFKFLTETYPCRR